MLYNGIIVYKGISFGETITSVLDWIPIILCEKYFPSMKYHFITTNGGGGVSKISLCITMRRGGLEGVNFVSRDK